MRRDLNVSRSGGRQLGTPWVGQLGSTVPAMLSGALGGSPLYNDVQASGWQADRVTMHVTSHNLGTLFVREDLGIEGTVPADGTYTINFEVWLNGALFGTSVATINVGAVSGVLANVVITPVMGALVGATVAGSALAPITLTPTMSPLVGTTAGPGGSSSSGTLVSISLAPVMSALVGNTLIPGAWMAAAVRTLYVFSGDLRVAGSSEISLLHRTRPIVQIDAEAVLDFGWDWSAWLQDSGASAGTFTVADQAGVQLLETSPNATGLGVLITPLPGAQSGFVTCRVVLSGTPQRVDERSIHFEVLER